MSTDPWVDPRGKGDIRVAFPFFVLAVAVLGFGTSVPLPLAAIRIAVFALALGLLVRGRGGRPRIPGYLLGVACFSVLALGHAFSSVYVWVSLQHGVNIALAGIVLALALGIARDDPGGRWRLTLSAVAVLAFVESAVAAYQRAAAGSLRARGTFDNPNFLAEFLAVAGVLFLARSLFREKGSGTRRLDAALAAAFLAAGLVLPASRGVLVALVPALGILCVSRWGMKKGLALLGAGAVPLLLLAGYGSITRFFLPDPHGFGRWAIWKAAWGTVVENPFGVGLGGFKYYWFSAQSPFVDAFRRYGKHAVWAHNEYLEVLVGLGCIGFLVFLALLAGPLLAAFRHRREFAGETRGIAAGASAALVLSGVHAFVNPGFHNMGIVVLDATLLGALLACLPPSSALARPLEAPGWLRVPAAAALLALLAVSVAAYGGTYFQERAGRLLSAGRPREAETWLARAARIDPLRASIADAVSGFHFQRYRGVFREREEPEPPLLSLAKAIRWQVRARELCPMEHAYALRLSALAFERYRVAGAKSDLSSAFSVLDEGLALNPFSAEGLWQRASMAAAVGRTADAVRDLEAAVAFEPNFCRAYGKLAQLAEPADPRSSARWREKEAICLKKAAPRSDQKWETWFLEPPE